MDMNWKSIASTLGKFLSLIIRHSRLYDSDTSSLESGSSAGSSAESIGTEQPSFNGPESEARDSFNNNAELASLEYAPSPEPGRVKPGRVQIAPEPVKSKTGRPVPDLPPSPGPSASDRPSRGRSPKRVGSGSNVGADPRPSPARTQRPQMDYLQVPGAPVKNKPSTSKAKSPGRVPYGGSPESSKRSKSVPGGGDAPPAPMNRSRSGSGSVTSQPSRTSSPSAQRPKASSPGKNRPVSPSSSKHNLNVPTPKKSKTQTAKGSKSKIDLPEIDSQVPVDNPEASKLYIMEQLDEAVELEQKSGAGTSPVRFVDDELESIEMLVKSFTNAYQNVKNFINLRSEKRKKESERARAITVSQQDLSLARLNERRARKEKEDAAKASAIAKAALLPKDYLTVPQEKVGLNSPQYQSTPVKGGEKKSSKSKKRVIELTPIPSKPRKNRDVSGLSDADRSLRKLRKAQRSLNSGSSSKCYCKERRGGRDKRRPRVQFLEKNASSVKVVSADKQSDDNEVVLRILIKCD